MYLIFFFFLILYWLSYKEKKNDVWYFVIGKALSGASTQNEIN